MATAAGKAVAYTAASACGVDGLLYRRRQRTAEAPEMTRHNDAWNLVLQRQREG
jgi:hypothetical protein